jgi:hypothetical protein
LRDLGWTVPKLGFIRFPYQHADFSAADFELKYRQSRKAGAPPYQPRAGVNKPPGRSPGGLIQQLPANGRFRCIPTLKIEPIWLTKSQPT